MEMEGTGDGSVEQEDPREWSPHQEIALCQVHSWSQHQEIGNKRPSPESNSGVEGASEVTESNSVIDGDRPSKKTRAKRHVFTALEKQILVNLYETNKLMDTKGIKDVVLLLSKDDNKLSEAQVKTWVDNYKSSLRKKQKGKETDPKDKDQE
jgi:hypothetical protein